MTFLNLIRYQNLIIIILTQVVVKYGFLEVLDIPLSLNDLQFTLLVLITVFIAAAGNIINDIYDVDIDAINKPQKLLVGKKISEKNAYTLFIILNIIGVAIGFYLSNSIGRPGFAAMFIIISALLYIYASYLKAILLIGNIIVSVLVAMSLLIVGIFDIIPAISADHLAEQRMAMMVLLHYSFFAFLVNLTREILKDIQDINGDKNGGINTLAIALGRVRANYVVFGLAVLTMLLVVGYMYVFLYSNQTIILYFLFLIIAPLLYFCVRAWSAETAKDHAFLSLLLKIIMFLGMCSILLYHNLILN